jgi:hypothetical protein
LLFKCNSCRYVPGIDAQLNGGEIPDDSVINKVLHAYNNTSEIMGQLFITPVPILKLQNLLGIGRVRELKEGYKVGLTIVIFFSFPTFIGQLRAPTK